MWSLTGFQIFASNESLEVNVTNGAAQASLMSVHEDEAKFSGKAFTCSIPSSFLLLTESLSSLTLFKIPLDLLLLFLLLLLLIIYIIVPIIAHTIYTIDLVTDIVDTLGLIAEKVETADLIADSIETTSLTASSLESTGKPSSNLRSASSPLLFLFFLHLG